MEEKERPKNLDYKTNNQIMYHGKFTRCTPVVEGFVFLGYTDEFLVFLFKFGLFTIK